MRERLVVFTDLDGTLLDARTYSFGPAKGALARLKAAGVPLVLCTSKTAAETLHYRMLMGNSDPFIVENGGGVYVPEGYFTRIPTGAACSGGYCVKVFGAPYAKLREAVAALRAQGFELRGFGDMTAAEVAALTGLSTSEAGMAKAREYDEPFVYEGPQGRLSELVAAIGRMGLNHTSGRLMHILGDNDKGRALTWLSGLYREESGGITTAGLGDSPNDAPMLAAVDRPFLVNRPEGHHPDVAGGRIRRVAGVGPVGWAEAVDGLLDELGL